jgi:sugar lactone lactonase YvrE
VLAAMLVAVPVASGSPGPGPLAHAPRFARVLGQQALAQPAGVAVDPDGHVWVADTGHGRVVEFSAAGRVLAAFGVAGSSRERLNHPVALAVTPSGDVWVADQGNGRVVEFSADGRYRVSFAVPTSAGVGLDARGDVWVSSPGYALAGGNSVREFTPAGHQLRSFGITQAGYGDLSNPGGIAVGPDGRIYVAQPDYGLVSVFSPAGSFYTEFGLQPDPGRSGWPTPGTTGSSSSPRCPALPSPARRARRAGRRPF